MRGRAPGGARLFFECPNGQKSFKNLVLKSNKNLWGAPAAHFIWNRSASEKLFKNLVQKLIALRAEIIGGRSASEKSYKIDSKSYRICAYAFGIIGPRHASRGNYSKI